MLLPVNGIVGIILCRGAKSIMESLYRFISFPAFVNLVEQKQERYVRPTSWEDTYEGYFLSRLEKDDIKKCLMQLADAICQNVPETAVDNYLKLYNARWNCYGQCWTKRFESDALWRIYSYEKMAVRIETDEEQIREVLSPVIRTNGKLLIIDNVHYDLDNEKGELKTQEQLLEELAKSKRVVEPYFHKRKAFEHEEEKRVIFFDNDESNITTMMRYCVINNGRRKKINEKTFEEQIRMLSDEIERCCQNRTYDDSLKMKFFHIPQLERYIKSVMVHPQAEDWIVSLVETICQRVGLKFLGKSQMYSRVG